METFGLAELERAIQVAAEEAYQSEVVETAMEESTIGEGMEYADKEDWIETKIGQWIAEGKEAL